MLSRSITAKRSIIAIVAAAVCFWAVWQSARTGLARTLGERALVTSETSTADEAVKLSPADAETHCVRGVLWERAENYAQAQLEVERAVRLRPRDYSIWLLLGMTRDENHDQEGALRAFRQSTALAPAYALPHWQLGNLLLRMGQTDPAFAELRQAASSNPAFLLNVIDLAWGVYGQDAGAVIRVLQPVTDTTRMALALFFAGHKESAAALDQFRQLSQVRSTGTESDPNNQSLLGELLQARAFAEAYEVWARLNDLPATSAAEVRDGGFEGPISVGQTGFGWQITRGVANVTMSVDEGEHQQGGRSLRIDFRGDSTPTSPLLTQLMLVKPVTRYHVGVAALSKEFVSAADPVITLVDASDGKGTVLAQSPPLRSDPKVWREFAIDFTTNAGTRAITITVARQACANNPCPAFGTVWLDSLVLELRSGPPPSAGGSIGQAAR